MKLAKRERESEQKGRNLGLIRKPYYYHTAADDFEIYLESSASWHVSLVQIFRHQPVHKWPDEAYGSVRWLLVYGGELRLLGLVFTQLLENVNRGG